MNILSNEESFIQEGVEKAFCDECQAWFTLTEEGIADCDCQFSSAYFLEEIEELNFE